MFYRVSKKLLFFSITSILISFLIGLLGFKEKILSIKNYNTKKDSNIVILTGGTNRIKDGLKIIDNFNKPYKKRFKILVSGTGKGYSKKTLKKQLGSNFYPELVECCIDLDSVSKNTLTNASETSKWVLRNNIKEFILITSNYHMPRAILEFNNSMPNQKIYTFSIRPKKHDIEKWLDSYETFSLIFKEFCKYIVAYLRIKILTF